MALIHKATLQPSKLQLLTGWLPSRSWFPDGTEIRQLGSYRFDDPAGAVGVEAFLLEASDEAIVHVPLTYRGAPLAGAEEFLIGTTEHSVLGTRWVYDGCGDPIWASTLATAVLNGGTQADELVDNDGQLVPRAPTATVKGSGKSGTSVGHIETVTCRDDGPITIVRANRLDLMVIRTVGTAVEATQTLIGTWPGHPPVQLAGVRAV
ncbi:MAG: CG0192-related protein [Acidothermaceae bacterium]